MLPFRLLPPGEAVIPYDGTRLLSGADDRIDRYPGLAGWWREAETTWDEHKAPATRLSLLGQADYMHKLTAQFPAAPFRVVYTTAGTYLTAAVLTDSRSVVESALYWATAGSLDEARYLTALLNAPILTELVRPYQSVGAFGPRHFHKYVWYVPVPEFDPKDSDHQHLVRLAEQAESIAAAVALSAPLRFQAVRGLIRRALLAEGVADEIDEVVRAFVETHSRHVP